MKIIYNNEAVEVSLALSNTEDGTSMSLRLSKKIIDQEGRVVDDILLTRLILPQTENDKEKEFVKKLTQATQEYFNG